jgi:predicted phosphodiesterase
VSYPLTAILADLHGNRPALETALQDARERGVRRFVCLGDVVGYGSDPRHNLDHVMRLCVPEPDGSALGYAAGELAPGFCLQGNHEHALLNSAEDFNPKARAAIEWTREELTRGPSRETSYDYWDFVGGLVPLVRDEAAMFAHGSPRDPVREYVLPRDIQDEAKMRANFALLDRPVCFVGHSHVPAVYYADQRLYRPRDTEGPYDLGEVPCIVNVGSVGQPRDGDRRLSYCLFDGRNVTFVRLAYDVEAAQAGIRAVAALPDYLADRLAVGR